MRTVLATAAVLAGLVLAPTALAATPGVNTDSPAAAKAAGAKMARIFVVYPDGATAPSSAAFAGYDGLVAGFAAQGVKALFVVTGKGTPPSDINHYAQFVGALAARYDGQLAGLEIWNEQDAQLWWASPNAGVYAAMLRASYGQVGGRAPVILGGLTGNNYAFLGDVYAALGGGSGGAFDAVAVHTDTACSIVGPDSFFRNPDGRISQWSFLGLREVHAVMAAHGDAAKKIWMTELGWNTSSGRCDTGVWAGQKDAGVSEAQQATFLRQAYACLDDYDYVEHALWFNLVDTGGGDSNAHYGLLRTDGTAKPAYKAFQDVAAGRGRLEGFRCGDFDPPSLTVATPTDGGQFVDVLPLDVRATDSGGVGRITLSADGKLIRNFTTGKTRATGFPSSLRGAIDWQGGKKLALGEHTITVVALDGNGNMAKRTLKLTKVRASALKRVTTRFTPLRLKGSGRNRVLEVKLRAATGVAVAFRARHKVKVDFQKLVHGHWKTAHRYTKSAKAPVRIPVRLEQARWRVRATFAAQAPFRKAQTSYLRFTV